jgi:glycine/D-amino acid oxidase-like deaminating enzyme
MAGDDDATLLYDLAIVGGGIMGACAAWRAAAAGLTVVLLERSPAATHSTGSSHGHSRIVRRTYLQPHYARLMNLAYPLWEELSQLSGCGPLRAYPPAAAQPPPLVRHTGGLSLVHRGSAAHADLLAACASAGVAVREVPAEEAARRWGLALPASTLALHEAGDTGCAVGAGRCVAAAQAAAVALGAVLRLGAEVAGVALAAPGRGSAAVLALRGGGSVRARRVVLCPGAWAAPLLQGALGLPALPLQPLLCSTAYFGLRKGAGAAPPEPLPVLIDWRAADGRGVYGAPVTEWGPEGQAFPGAFKFAIHAGAPTTAAGRPQLPDEAVTVAPVAAWVAQHAPLYDPAPLAGSTTTCLYTMTPDEDFVLDEVPLEGRRGVVFVCAGFSGHGFKFGPLVGEIAARWARAALASGEGSSDDGAALREVEAWLQQATAAAAAASGSGGGAAAAAPLLARFSLSRPAMAACPAGAAQG